MVVDEGRHLLYEIPPPSFGARGGGSLSLQLNLEGFHQGVFFFPLMLMKLVFFQDVITFNRCYLCYAEEGTIDYLLVHCEVTSIVWPLLFSVVLHLLGHASFF